MTTFTKLPEAVKKYGDELGSRILRRNGHEKIESYREYGAGFFGGEVAKSRPPGSAQLFFNKLSASPRLRLLAALLTVACLAWVPKAAVAEGHGSAKAETPHQTALLRTFSPSVQTATCKKKKQRLKQNSAYRYSQRTGFVLLPLKGKGYYHFSGPDHPDEDAWGAPETIACVELVAAEWSGRYPKRPRIGIGDISRRAGGRFSPHVTHRHGLDLDIRPVKRSGEGRTTIAHAAYSRAYTRDLIQLFTEVCAVQRILFNDPVLTKQLKNVRKSGGHDDHLHISLKSAKRQPDAVVERANQIRMIAKGIRPSDSTEPSQTASNP